ncbi:YqgE/AlgH family protein [Bacteroidia bacterium]|nr:YqgE/AlgH family protein [Bacteroidia bacterium]
MPNVHWGGDFDEVCSGIQNKVLKPQEFKFFVGYSGWAPGQLAHELKYHSWITGSLDADLIFNLNIDDEHLWKIALRTKGGSEALLANAPSDLLLN